MNKIGMLVKILNCLILFCFLESTKLPFIRAADEAEIVNNECLYAAAQLTRNIEAQYDQSIIKKWGYIDFTGVWVIPPEYEDATLGIGLESTTNGYLYPAKQNGKWGYLNSKNVWIIPPRFEDGNFTLFKNDRAYISTFCGEKTEAYFIDTKGTAVFSVKSNSIIGQFAENKAWSYSPDSPGKIDCIDTNGKQIFTNVTTDNDYTKYRSRSIFSENCLAVKKEGKWGYIDSTGKWIIPPIYEDAYPFSEGYAIVSKNKKYGYVDTNGNIKIQFQFDSAKPFSENLAFVLNDKQWSIIDKQGMQYTSKTYMTHSVVKDSLEQNWIFHNGLACVSDGAFWGYIDKTGNYIIEPKYTDAYFFDNNQIAYAKIGEMVGYINILGEWVYRWY